MKSILNFLFNDDLIYPPNKIKDIHNINNVRLNRSLLKSFLWLRHVNNITTIE
jgi:hypothetical protein